MNDSLAPARGIIIGVIISSIFWLLIVAAVIHTSTWTELGRRAVEQGVIR